MRSVIAFSFLISFLVLAVSACKNSHLRSFDGQFCSTTTSDDPFFECSPAYDFVCIATYSVDITNPKANETSRPVYLCRLACDPGDGCRNAEDVCCAGKIYGRDYGKSHACVPRQHCESVGNATSDGGAADARPPTDRPTGASDAGGSDGAANDAGALDAPSPDA